MELSRARAEIAAIDEQMAALFVRRMEAVRDIATYKHERGIPIEDKKQESQAIERCATLVEDDQIRSFYIQFLQATMDVSKRWQHRLMEGLRIAYCGVEGAFAHIAATRIFPDGTAVPHQSFEEAYVAVESGTCDVAVLPVENSRTGEVGPVLDLMFSGPLHVSGMYDLAIVQNLLGVPGASLADVRSVISHPQAIAQCRSYLQAHDLDAQSAPNTAVAAQQVAAAGDPSLAAIASDKTASLYGLSILDHDINEDRSNTTRFAVLSRVEGHVSAGKDDSAFILMFTVKDEAGGLAKAVDIISAFGYNMRVLRSHPVQDLPWHYYFYVEAEGDDSSENGRRMITALRGACPMVKVVGRYSTADSVL